MPKHKGISFFMLPMRQPGVEVRPIHQITGESEFNEVFLTDAVVPAENLVGPLNATAGAVLQTALGYERRLMGDLARTITRAPASRRTNEDSLIALAREFGRLDDAHIRQQIARIARTRRGQPVEHARAKASTAPRPPR